MSDSASEGAHAPSETPEVDAFLATVLNYQEGSADPEFLRNLVKLARALERRLKQHPLFKKYEERGR